LDGRVTEGVGDGGLREFGAVYEKRFSSKTT
jgi:hypothetical protein